jgi:alkanesulfonate monooxygenase SsuD/methylene tetrahydromethanopterin reductase-like flavin-dependent oxidoreductase (luciferase family)
VPRLVLNYDLRHPASFGASAGATYAAALDQIAWADEHGFAFVALGEHHQSPDGYLSCPLVFAAAIGGRTKTIRVRVSALLAPLYDPIRLAEEIAVADLCLGGRLDVGIAAGYVRQDFAMFGADYTRRGRELESTVALLRQAWTGEPFLYRGTMVRVTPRPAQDPMPLYLGGTARPAIERAARIADGYFPPTPGRWEVYRDACVGLGRPDPGPMPRQSPIFCWVTRDDKEEVWARLAPHVRHQTRSYAAWTSSGLGRPAGPFVDADGSDDVRPGGAYLVLTPEETVELARDLGDDGRLNFSPLLAGIDLAWSWSMLRLVEAEVLPRLGPSPR